ncbi:MAG: hypothetical protein A3I04_04970 [Nitrospinae bacterium RIFCSPLOWO2_02_FULL_39_110]|nr:MAG: hypothetical protein A3D97_04030 [Nitrospinae bacterium RIFCSPHIGHO2_12_FULL_39_42]OGW00479.1 MAG: hypothetical protein A3D20_05000 [Nitrospinae bacterium RIFCSPHIGHO2_02_FULL_39_82]OGW04876.1 MAG: hypothetical protein A3I04_04970 [Nitrospinae bacterium RIFCSPLOWO2_02_FULL_39_110]OGW09971.1 MAG: hypothetical protein A3F81_07430 [Nitrospinae bacterium RIFCSPLOWO2_12_FULL_39_93]
MPFAPSKKKKRRSRLTEATLTLTSMMDMFTIILLFLLVNYSAEGIVVTNPRKLSLPLSISQKTPTRKLDIQITSEDIIVEGVKVMDTKDAMENQDYSIKPLLDALNENTKKVEFIAKNNPSFKFTGEVMIQGDKGIPFILLEKIMYTCGQAGYGGISLAVISRE